MVVQKIDPIEGAPFRVSNSTTRNWFEAILYYFKYTSALRSHGTPYTGPMKYFRSCPG